MGREKHRWIEGLSELEYLYLDVSELQTQLNKALSIKREITEEVKDRLTKEVSLMLNTVRYLIRYTRSRYSESLPDDYTNRYEVEKGLNQLLYFVQKSLEKYDHNLTDKGMKHTLKRVRLVSQKSTVEYYINLVREGRAVHNLR